MKYCPTETHDMFHDMFDPQKVSKPKTVKICDHIPVSPCPRNRKRNESSVERGFGRGRSGSGREMSGVTSLNEKVFASRPQISLHLRPHSPSRAGPPPWLVASHVLLLPLHNSSPLQCPAWRQRGVRAYSHAPVASSGACRAILLGKERTARGLAWPMWPCRAREGVCACLDRT